MNQKTKQKRKKTSSEEQLHEDQKINPYNMLFATRYSYIATRQVI
jgi:hypothetical protein